MSGISAQFLEILCLTSNEERFKSRVKPRIVIHEMASHWFRILNRINPEIQHVRMKLMKKELIHIWLESCHGGWQKCLLRTSILCRPSKETQKLLLRKQNLKTPVPQTILWKKPYILKVESQNVKTFRQDMNSYLCSVFSFSTWRKPRHWKPKPTMRTRGKVRKGVIYHVLPSDRLILVGFPTWQST